MTSPDATPRVQLATLCYVKHAGRTLMLHRNRRPNDFHQGKWNGLGGKFEAGETPEQCVIRELEEESGLRLHAPELRGVLTFPRFKDGVDWYVFVYVARQFDGELKTDIPEGELAWIPDDQLLKLNLWEGDWRFLEWLEQGRFFSGTFTYVNGRVVAWDVTFHPPPAPAASLRGSSQL